MRGKLWTVIGVLVVVSLLLAACAPAATPQVVEKPVVQTQIVEKQVVQTQVVEKQSTVQVVVTATPEPVKERPKVTIDWWTDPAFNTAPKCPTCKNPGDYEKMLIDKYTKDNPNVTVNVQVLDWGDLPTKIPAAVAGEPPDIVKDYLGRTSGFAYEPGVLVDMNKVLPKEVIDDILPGLKDLYTINGMLHAFPAYFWEQHLMYNKALLQKAGITDAEMPKDDWTFDDFANLIAKVKKAVPEVTYGYGTQVASEQGDYANHAFIWSAGSRTWKADCSGLDLDNPKALAGFEFFNKLYQDGMMNKDATTAGWQDVDNLFFTGKIVFEGGGLTNQEVILPQAIKDGKVTVPMDAQQTLYPHAAGEPVAGLPVGPTGYVIFDKKDRTPEQLDEIVKFLLYINSPDVQRDETINIQQFPSRLSTGVPLAGDPKYEQALAWVQKYGTSTMGLQCPHFYEIRTMQPAYWQQMLLGKTTPQQTIDAIMAQSKKIMGQ